MSYPKYIRKDGSGCVVSICRGGLGAENYFSIRTNDTELYRNLVEENLWDEWLSEEKTLENLALFANVYDLILLEEFNNV